MSLERSIPLHPGNLTAPKNSQSHKETRLPIIIFPRYLLVFRGVISNSVGVFPTELVWCLQANVKHIINYIVKLDHETPSGKVVGEI